ncbi:hypothetical protein [Shewanella fidelis]|uniref:hypothetical protein n=1 Tax=Shewanella fidelis TaxID=173509 RepID=UPI0012EB34D8|nr:hypothetical protein [Shewanella fidelis]
MMTMMRKLLAVSITTALTLGMTACSSDEETVEIEVPVPAAPLEVTFERAYKATPDGAWFGLHDERNELNYQEYNAGRPMPNGAEPWINSQYVLASTATETKIWYGAATSVYCYWPMVSMAMPMALMNYETERQACQLMAPTGQMPDAQAFVFDPATGENIHLNDKTVKNGEQYWADMMDFHGHEIGIKNAVKAPEGTDPKLVDEDGWLLDESGDLVLEDDQTRYPFSFRGNGQSQGLVFVMGYLTTPDPDMVNKGDSPKIGYNRLFVFNEAEMEYLGYAEFTYDTVRRFITVEHKDGSEGMYWFGGPDQSGGQAGVAKNQMLRWVGTPDEPLKGGSLGNGFDIVSDDSFLDYGVVGDVDIFQDKDGDNRLVMSSWYNPTGSAAAKPYTSKMPDSGFTAENKASYKDFFKYDQYDPDTTAAHGSKLAAQAFYDGYLYFGSYHQGTSGAYDHLIKKHCVTVGFNDDGTPIEEGSLCELKNSIQQQDELTIAKHDEFMMKTWRALSLFRIKTEDIVDGSVDDVELLYGNEEDWVFVDDGKDGYHFEMQPNKMGQKPLFGKEGFGHEGLVYAFTMTEHDGKLFLGTWNATAGLYDIFENGIEGYKHPDSHNKVALGTEVINPNDIAAQIGQETEKGIYDEMYAQFIADGMSPEEAHKQALIMSKLLNPIPTDGGMAGEERVVQNNPAYFLYNAVKEQNQDDDLAGRGGWLAVFEDSQNPATIVDKYGFGNTCNNGIRNYSKVGGELYFGTTSYCNLGDEAGLEFYKYTGDNR